MSLRETCGRALCLTAQHTDLGLRMSDLASLEKLARSTAQLPVNVYFDDKLLALETDRLFKQGPRYAGHTLMVPNEGDYATLPWENDGRVLVRNAQGLELISNVCRHRQAKMLSGRGNADNIICPLHRWTYDLKGELIGAPHFADTPCMNLSRFGCSIGTACCLIKTAST